MHLKPLWVTVAALALLPPSAAYVTVPILAETNNTLWLSALDIEVCYSLPGETNATEMRLELARPAASYIHSMVHLPDGHEGCVNLTAWAGDPGITTREAAYVLRVVESVSSTVLSSTDPFALATMVMAVSPGCSSNATVLTLRIDGEISQPGSATPEDVVRLVDRDDNVTAECYCHPGSLPSPKVRCAFDVPRGDPAAPTRGPYRFLFYSNGAATPASVLHPYDADTAAWAALGI
jgi:hypothetical protein